MSKKFINITYLIVSFAIFSWSLASSLPVRAQVSDSTTILDSAKTTKPQPHKARRAFALKTNLLYWGTLTPNIEAELYLSPQWSVNLEGQYGWWSNRQKHRYWRILAVSPEARFHFGRNDYFKGHFVGGYVAGGMYEFMFHPEYGIQGEVYYAAGLSYGYQLPVSRKVGFEFSIGLGFMHARYKEYHWDGKCYEYDRFKSFDYLGITKAKVAIIFQLKKGGKP